MTMNNKMKIEKHYKIIVIIFFIGYLFTGLILFNDYGLSWDEIIQRDIGIMNYKYITEGDQKLIGDPDKYHGPFFELLLFTLEIGLNGLRGGDAYLDSRTVYFLRHLVTFVMFYISVFFFYLLCKHRFNSWKVGLLGSLFLILSPRIFAHSFYNPKDLPFLSMFIISIYTLVKFLEKKSVLRASMHALACAILIDIRMMGILVPLFTLFFTAIDLFEPKRSPIEKKKSIPGLLSYLFLLVSFIILFWPILWEGPVYHFIEAFKDSSRHPWIEDVLYLGQYINATNIPWHYTPVWMTITTPPLYLGTFFIGLISSFSSMIKNPITSTLIHPMRQDFIFLSWLFLPLFVVIVLNSVLYDGYRHMFFIYPALLMISLRGLTSVFEFCKRKLKGQLLKRINMTLMIIILFGLFPTTLFMVKNHPFQNVYFNRLAGKDMKSVKNNFELDYWGLSYRKALEYILNNDDSDIVAIYPAQLAGIFTRDILKAEHKYRLKCVRNTGEAKYFVSNFRWHKEEYPYEDEFFSIRIRGTRIIVVYRLEEKNDQNLRADT